MDSDSTKIDGFKKIVQRRKANVLPCLFNGVCCISINGQKPSHTFGVRSCATFGDPDVIKVGSIL